MHDANAKTYRKNSYMMAIMVIITRISFNFNLLIYYIEKCGL
jgi:hypothetical protein